MNNYLLSSILEYKTALNVCCMFIFFLPLLYVYYSYLLRVDTIQKKNEVIKCRVRTTMTTDEEKKISWQKRRERKKKPNLRCDFIL